MNRFFELPRPVIFAHRGDSAHAPENTLAAFRQALQKGAPAVELDAKLSKDGTVMVIHDPDTIRTTGVPGLVRRMTCAALQALDAGSFFDARFIGERIPTLDDVLEEVGGKLLVNIELTNYAAPFDELPDKVAAIVQRHALADQVIFSSFNPANLERIRRVLPGTPAGILAFPGIAGALARSRLFLKASPALVHPHHSAVTPAYLENEHRRARQVNTWTVNSPERIQLLYAWGIDGIITDDPAFALSLLNQVKEQR